MLANSAGPAGALVCSRGLPSFTPNTMLQPIDSKAKAASGTHRRMGGIIAQRALRIACYAAEDVSREHE
jgi:hypothetical protein